METRSYLNFKTKREKVLFFIDNFKRFESHHVLENTFLKGYCYYFGVILKDRFGGQLLYDEKDGHFVTKINRYLYDIRGDVTEIYKGRLLLDEKKWKQKQDVVYGCIEKYVKW